MWNRFRRVTTIARANQYILGRPVLQGTFNSTMEMMMLDFKWSASTRHGTFTMGWLRAVVKCSLRLQQIYGPFDVRHMVRRTILRPRGERRSLEHDDIEDEVARVSSSARSVNIFFHVHHGHGNVFAAITPVSTASIIIGCRGVASLAVYTLWPLWEPRKKLAMAVNRDRPHLCRWRGRQAICHSYADSCCLARS